MSFFNRIVNVFRPRSVHSDIEEELQSHFEDAAAEGRDPAEARRAFGSRVRTHEAMRDEVVAPWLDSLLADARFGFRQLRKNRSLSIAAILSLGLAMGACMAAFRLIDAVMLRPLPVSDPGGLYMVGTEIRDSPFADTPGQPQIEYVFDYPGFRELRDAVKDDAAVMAITAPNRVNLTYNSGRETADEEMERVNLQFFSGATFSEFGLSPALGRLLTEADDQTPKGNPYAVLSYDYWARRFGKDPAVLGRKFRTGNDLFEIVGVAPKGFTGTEPGTFTDIFVPTMMYPQSEALSSIDWVWFSPWVRIPADASAQLVREKLRAAMLAHRQEQVRQFPADTPRSDIADYLASQVVLSPAGEGLSDLQRGYGRPLTVLGLLVALVLLVTCVNVANLMTAQAAARAREMALRVSIGAGRRRLVQLVLMESALIATIASVIGGVLAWQASPLVVAMINRTDAPIRLDLPIDGRMIGFAAVLLLFVTMLFGIIPALQASAITPATALKGGSHTRSRQRLMHTLIAAQVAFCVMVLLVAGLFVSTFKRLSSRPLGFSPAGVIALETVAPNSKDPDLWYAVAEHLRSISGVDNAAVAGWALMSGAGWNGYVWANGHSPEDEGTEAPWFLGVSPGWFETMKISVVAGRPFNRNDAFPRVVIVNQTFARRYFEGQDPIGQTLDMTAGTDHKRVTLQIVGIASDSRYFDLRRNMPATVYVPFRSLMDNTTRPPDFATFLVRTKASDPLSLSSYLRREVHSADPDFRVASIRTQDEMIQAQMIRERLLATLSVFFGGVAVLLAGIGLYGVLNYVVIQRRRELGIRMALGAQVWDVACRVTVPLLMMVGIGTGVGIGLGVSTARYVSSLLFMVKATDLPMMVWPCLAMLAAGLIASVQPVLRAIHIHPASLLRME